eukprot:5645382-Pleurochrysis_carterae.AAC.1
MAKVVANLNGGTAAGLYELERTSADAKLSLVIVRHTACGVCNLTFEKIFSKLNLGDREITPSIPVKRVRTKRDSDSIHNKNRLQDV